MILSNSKEDTCAYIIFYGNPLLPIPPEAFDMCNEQDFIDRAWQRYLVALEKIDWSKFQDAIAEAEEYCNEPTMREILREIAARHPQTNQSSVIHNPRESSTIN